MTIPTDNVDEAQLRRPAHWAMRLIRRFMIVFGPINALMDVSIFAVMLVAFQAGPALFRSGFFVESFVTQTLIIFAIRTRRVPFFRSRSSRAYSGAPNCPDWVMEEAYSREECSVGFWPSRIVTRLPARSVAVIVLAP